MLKQFVLAGAIALVSAATLSAQTSAPAATTTKAATQQPAKPTTAKPATPAKVTADQIKMAQESLTKGGMYKGKVDGVWNNELSASLKKYQEANKLKVTGKLDTETLAKLEPPKPAMAPAQ
jgi:peptidoglycan hydrolase-like protein with peptidoglycan-binding domain